MIDLASRLDLYYPLESLDFTLIFIENTFTITSPCYLCQNQLAV